jgi:Pyruvate/2-oxoacid:ferredoxin oxidoreductase delta subunit
MVQEKLEKLESILDRIDDTDDISAEELREIYEGLETGKKYKCATCQMFCTGEDIMVIYNTETEEFIQIEVPMDENEDLVVTRAS